VVRENDRNVLVHRHAQGRVTEKERMVRVNDVGGEVVEPIRQRGRERQPYRKLAAVEIPQ
jgi:hypothetical protein